MPWWWTVNTVPVVRMEPAARRRPHRPVRDRAPAHGSRPSSRHQDSKARESLPRRLAAPPAHRLRESGARFASPWRLPRQPRRPTSPKSLTPRFFSDDRLLNNRSRALGMVHPARGGRSVGGELIRSSRGASEARRTCGTTSGVRGREVVREAACCSACDWLCDLRVASASTLRIASSSARRSFVICASKSAGWFERSCATHHEVRCPCAIRQGRGRLANAQASRAARVRLPQPRR